MNFSKMKQTDIARALGFHRTTIHKWASEEPPCPRNSDGSYNLKKVVQWLIFRAEENTEPTAEGSHWLEEFRKHRARLAELEVEVKEKSLVSREAVIKSWAARWGLQKVLLWNLPPRAAPLLIGKSVNEIRQILQDEVRSIFREFVKASEYTPKAEK